MIVLRLPARFPLRFLMALLLGVLHAVAFSEDATWPLEIAALAGLVSLIARVPEGLAGFWPAARAGFAFGLGWFLTGISWIYVSLHTYGEMPPPLAGAATFLLCAYLSLFPALACGLAGLALARGRERALLLAAFPGLWMLAEVGRGTLFTGFPWLATGYAHVGGPLAGYAALAGVHGVTLAAAAVATALALLGNNLKSSGGTSARLRSLALAVIVGLPLIGWGAGQIEWSAPSGNPLRVRLLQGNIPQEMKFVEGRFDSTVATYLGLIEKAPADLIVLPETAFPRFIDSLPADLIARLQHDSVSTGSAIAFGVPIADSRTAYFNSVVAINGGAGLQRYDKSHLVPFGEFIPFGFRWFVDLMKMPLGDFTSGATDQQPLSLAGHRVAFNVCYEDLFGEEIIRQVPQADVLVNVSNVAWFGDSLALPQHLQIARMRALESARPMLRATNTGMTAAVDPRGKVLGVLAPFTTGSLDLTVQGTTGLTPYVRAGNLPAILLALLLVALAVPRVVRPESKNPGRGVGNR